MLPPITRLKRVALDFLFPPWCIGCGKEGKYICDFCQSQLPFISSPFCSRCGRPLSNDATCPGCIGIETDIDGIRAPFLFNGVIRQAIHELKYRNLSDAASQLASFLDGYLQQNPLPCDVLVPIPVHSKRLRERGYNQSALLANELGRMHNIPVVEDCLIRQLYTPPQARTTNESERRKNIAGAFTCKDNRLSGKHVLLVDDVSTSGATLNAGAAALKTAGAAAVWGLVLALEL